MVALPVISMSKWWFATIRFLSATTAICTVKCPTLSGKVKLKIPAETQTGKLFRLRGKGVAPVRGGGVGDLLCRVVVETPVSLSAEQRKLLQAFEDSLDGQSQHSPRSSSWFDGVKKFFDNLTS